MNVEESVRKTLGKIVGKSYWSLSTASDPVEFAKEIILSSQADLLNFRSPRPWFLAVLTNSKEPCEKCSEKRGSYYIDANELVEDVVSSDDIPPFHPHCRCYIQLKLDTGTFDIDPSFPQSYTIVVLRPPEEIGAGREEQYAELKNEFDEAFNDYIYDLKVKENQKSGVWSKIASALIPPSCRQLADDLANIFESIVETYGAQRFVNLKVEEVRPSIKQPVIPHAWLTVEIKYLSNSGDYRTAKGVFDAWLVEEPVWEPEEDSLDE